MGISIRSTAVWVPIFRPAQVPRTAPLAVTEVLDDTEPVRIDEEQPLRTLLGAEGLPRLGAMVAVDEHGVLTGVVTLAQVRRALRLAT